MPSLQSINNVDPERDALCVQLQLMQNRPIVGTLRDTVHAYNLVRQSRKTKGSGNLQKSLEGLDFFAARNVSMYPSLTTPMRNAG